MENNEEFNESLFFKRGELFSVTLSIDLDKHYVRHEEFF